MTRLWLTGYSPYPLSPNDKRLPHLVRKLDARIAKTALGAEKTLAWEHTEDISIVLADLKKQSYTIAALEQAPNSIQLPDYDPPDKLALIVGREVEGLEPEILSACDIILEIPMSGTKESFNVTQATAMALYHCRFR